MCLCCGGPQLLELGIYGASTGLTRGATVYTEEECEVAITKATDIINERTKLLQEYTTGANDCAALLMEYDKALRGTSSKAQLSFTWKTPKEFLINLKRAGFTVEEYLTHCGYQTIKSMRPKVGDVAFSGGALIASPRGWITTTETNAGVVVAKQLMYLDRNLSIIARPKKDQT